MAIEQTEASRVGFISALACAGFGLAYTAAQIAEWLGWLGSSGGPNASSTPLGIAMLLLPSLLLGPSFVAMIAALHVTIPGPRRVYSIAALAFATIYAVLTGLVYFVQLTLVAPRMAAGDTTGIEVLLFVPYRSFLFAVDLLGYSFMCLSTLFAAAAIWNVGRARSARFWLLLNGLLLPALAFQMLVPQLIWIGAIWAVSFPAAVLQLSRYFRDLDASA